MLRNIPDPKDSMLSSPANAVDVAAQPSARKAMRLNRLRPINRSTAEQIDEIMPSIARAAVEHDAKYADRHGEGPIQRLNARLHAMGPDVENLPDLPSTTARGVPQDVLTFRPLRM